MTRKKTLSTDLSNTWPDVFDGVTLNVLPAHYVEAIRISFKDGKTWEIEMEPGNKKKSVKEFQDGVSEILASYKEYIDEVDVKIDTNKVKKDVEKSIKRMLKRIKL